MRLWAALYAAIWIVLLQFLLAMIPFGQPYLLVGHYVLGVAIIAVAYSNFISLRRTTAPGRLKRTAVATFYISILNGFLGALLLLNVGAGWRVFDGISVWNGILFLHVINAFAIITQMAAVAVAYDMWEEKEFLQDTRPGEIPRMAGQPKPKPGP